MDKIKFPLKLNKSYSYNKFKVETNYKDAKMQDDKKNVIDDLILFTKESRDHDEVVKILNNAVIDEKIKKVDPIIYKTGDYLIYNLLKQDYPQVLKKLTEKNISIAPVFVDSVDKDNYTIMFTKIPGMNGKDLIPYKEGKDSLSLNAKLEAYKDIQKLLKAGLVNHEMLRTTLSWYITPETKKIIIPNWESLGIIKDEERTPILNKFHSMLFNQ